LKRAWTKKVKAVLACAAGDDALKGHLEPAQPKVKRRVRSCDNWLDNLNGSVQPFTDSRERPQLSQ